MFRTYSKNQQRSYFCTDTISSGKLFSSIGPWHKSSTVLCTRPKEILNMQHFVSKDFMFGNRHNENKLWIYAHKGFKTIRANESSPSTKYLFIFNTGLTTDNLSKKLFRCVSEEWNTANQEFIEDNPHCPPVHWLPIALPEDHLWGYVLWCATHLHKQTTTGEEQKQLRLLSNINCLTCKQKNNKEVWPVCQWTLLCPSQCDLHISW